MLRLLDSRTKLRVKGPLRQAAVQKQRNLHFPPGWVQVHVPSWLRWRHLRARCDRVRQGAVQKRPLLQHSRLLQVSEPSICFFFLFFSQKLPNRPKLEPVGNTRIIAQQFNIGRATPIFPCSVGLGQAVSQRHTRLTFCHNFHYLSKHLFWLLFRALRYFGSFFTTRRRARRPLECPRDAILTCT